MPVTDTLCLSEDVMNLAYNILSRDSGKDCFILFRFYPYYNNFPFSAWETYKARSERPQDKPVVIELSPIRRRMNTPMTGPWRALVMTTGKIVLDYLISIAHICKFDYSDI